MQLDLGALHNFQSDISAATKSGPKERAADSRAHKQTGTGVKENDFQSTLKRADGYRDVDNKRSNNRDEPVTKTENRSSGREFAKSGNKGQQDIQSPDDHHTRDRVLSDNNNTENVQEFLFSQNGAGPLDPNFLLTLDSNVTDSNQADGISKEIPLMTQTEGDKATKSVGSTGLTDQIIGSSSPDSGVSTDFKKENTKPEFATPTHVREISEHVKLDHTATTSQTPVGVGATDEMSKSITGPRGNELMEKTITETQNNLTRNDHSPKSSDSTDGRLTDKTLAAEQVGSAQLTKETQKKMESISPLSNKAPADGDSAHSKTTNASIKNSDIEHLSRMPAETDRHNQADKSSSGQSESRASQGGPSASANKFNADVEQNLKINDLISPSQRPAAGDVTSPPSMDQVEMRANIPKTDVLNQIVDRAVFKLNNEQSEVRIDLKPDFLGNVRPQIVTDSHQVNLRILAESSIVKELIEGNLGQLKNDLQSQGLKVDEIEVAVAKDFNDYGRNQEFTAHGGPGKRGSSSKGQKANESEPLDDHVEPTRVNTRPGGINCFA